MKLFKITAIGIILSLSTIINAQVSVNVTVGSPPPWGPAGYSESRYYYLPDVEAYYDIESSMFIYYGGGVWVHKAHLPSRYSNYDLYNGYKVVITDYRGNEPYGQFHNHKIKYKKGYRGGPQKTIGQKPGNGNSGYKKSPATQSEKRKTQGGNQNVGGGNNKGGGHGNGGGKGHKK